MLQLELSLLADLVRLATKHTGVSQVRGTSLEDAIFWLEVFGCSTNQKSEY